MRETFARFLIRTAKKMSPATWSKAVTASNNTIAVVVAMAYLDKMGFDHCSECAQTQGLFNIAGRAYCHRHKPKTESTVWAII
jgi:hypothetical protein